MLKRILPSAIIFMAIWWLVWQNAKPDCLGSAQETLQHDWSGANAYSVKVDRHSDICGFGPSDSYYVFKVRDAQTDNWREIMTYRHDDPVNLENRWVRVLGEKAAYVYIFDKFAATSDGGKNWSVWDAKENLADWKVSGETYSSRATIEKVNIDENGSGTMILEKYDGKTRRNAKIVRELYTEDFGKTWKASK